MQRREDLYDIAISVPDSAIILLSTVEISFGDLGRTAHVERRPHSTKIPLGALHSANCAPQIARQIASEYDIITRDKIPLLELRIKELIQLKSGKEDGNKSNNIKIQNFLRQSPILAYDSISRETAKIEKINDYVELIYDDNGNIQNKGMALILQLAQSPTNINILRQNALLITAMLRLLRQKPIRNYKLNANIIFTLYCMMDELFINEIILPRGVDDLIMAIIEDVLPLTLRRVTSQDGINLIQQEITRVEGNSFQISLFALIELGNIDLATSSLQILQKLAASDEGQIILLGNGIISRIIPYFSNNESNSKTTPQKTSTTLAPLMANLIFGGEESLELFLTLSFQTALSEVLVRKRDFLEHISLIIEHGASNYAHAPNAGDEIGMNCSRLIDILMTIVLHNPNQNINDSLKGKSNSDSSPQQDNIPPDSLNDVFSILIILSRSLICANLIANWADQGEQCGLERLCDNGIKYMQIPSFRLLHALAAHLSNNEQGIDINTQSSPKKKEIKPPNVIQYIKRFEKIIPSIVSFAKQIIQQTTGPVITSSIIGEALGILACIYTEGIDMCALASSSDLIGLLGQMLQSIVNVNALNGSQTPIDEDRDWIIAAIVGLSGRLSTYPELMIRFAQKKFPELMMSILKEKAHDPQIVVQCLYLFYNFILAPETRDQISQTNLLVRYYLSVLYDADDAHLSKLADTALDLISEVFPNMESFIKKQRFELFNRSFDWILSDNTENEVVK
ncbi:MAG: hypothetical protein EZS28_006221 [Streblomastix strix]|uniref:Uncharacterized protein n=1 Tax=Streblomastix strix TaxID=222440 RepID=A0A5J4WUL0_9EUKA|nr:MAG: hypothetical protein EZS28_006221 [Streblomastix strix]